MGGILRYLSLFILVMLTGYSLAQGGAAVRSMQRRLPLCQVHTYLSDMPEPCGEERAGGHAAADLHGQLSVFPNPVDDQLQVRLHLHENGRILLMDSNGRQIMEQMVPAESEQLTWQLGELPAGLYYLILESGSRVLDRQTIVIH
jgi:hypothetical protein